MDFLVDKDRVGVTESYSSEWIDLINRGGLVHVTEESHRLFISIDYNTCMPSHVHGEVKVNG